MLPPFSRAANFFPNSLRHFLKLNVQGISSEIVLLVNTINGIGQRSSARQARSFMLPKQDFGACHNCLKGRLKGLPTVRGECLWIKALGQKVERDKSFSDLT
ncbi:hypothetical protein DEMA109039_20580 [Deinococcus marmoris]